MLIRHEFPVLVSLVLSWQAVSVLAAALGNSEKPLELPHPLRPDVKSYEQEDASFWKRYGRNDLDRMLKATDEANMNRGRAKNVVLLVGDGMGIQTTTMARIFKGQKEGKKGEESSLAWEDFPFTGFLKTYNTDHQVPDSAGTATALFSGVKTKMAMVGLDHQATYNVCDPEVTEKAKLQTVLHWAAEADMQTGFVTNSRITHATPSSLYAHMANRDWESDSDMPEEYRQSCQDIASQLVLSEIGQKTNVMFGGGRRNFVTAAEGGRRLDGNLIETYKTMMRNKNAEVIENRQQMLFWEHAHSNHILGLFASSHMDYEVDRRSIPDPMQPSLSEMTDSALKRLTGPLAEGKGFFLMIEGARIDHAHHKNNPQRALEEVLEMEKALEVVLNHPNIKLNETLVIVTADHSHSVTMNGYPERGNPIFGYVFNPKRNLHIEYDNGIQMPYSTISYANGAGYQHHYLKETDRKYPDVIWRNLTEMDYNDIDYKSPAMMPGPEDYETHGGEDVAVYAMGPQAHLLTGVHEQSYVAHVISYSACIGDSQLSYACSRAVSQSSRAKSMFLSPLLVTAVVLHFA